MHQPLYFKGGILDIKVNDVVYSDEKLNFSKVQTEYLFILPDNFEETDDIENFYYSSSLDTFLKLAKQNDLPIKIIGKESDYKVIENRAIEWFAPVIFVSSLYYSQNPDAVSVALSMIANYLGTIFKIKKDTDVNLTVILNDEKKKISKKVEYKGNVEGLEKVNEIVKSTFDEMGDK